MLIINYSTVSIFAMETEVFISSMRDHLYKIHSIWGQSQIICNDQITEQEVIKGSDWRVGNKIYTVFTTSDNQKHFGIFI